MCCKDVFWYPSTIDYCIASEFVEPCMLRPVPEVKLRGTMATIAAIVEQEGACSLWRGLSLQLVQSIPANVVYFTAYEAMRDNSPIRGWPVLNPLVCGAIARTVATTAVSPLELIKTRLQSVKSRNAFSIVMKSVAEMTRNSGWGSLWSGLALTLWRDVPFSGIYWLVVEGVRDAFAAYRHQQHGLSVGDHERPRTAQQAFTESIAAGTAGGMIAAVATTPFDVGKTRKQLGHQSSVSANMRMLPFMAHIVREEGWASLYVGLVPRVLKVAPACAIMITSYEMSKHMFAERSGLHK